MAVEQCFTGSRADVSVPRSGLAETMRPLVDGHQELLPGAVRRRVGQVTVREVRVRLPDQPDVEEALVQVTIRARIKGRALGDERCGTDERADDLALLM